MRTSFALLATVISLLGLTTTASADCFGFREKDAVVCVPGSDNAARRRAESVCEEATGSECSISGVVAARARRAAAGSATTRTATATGA
jgi:molybdopterin biosynthesis enzyme MoaB